MKKVLAIAFIGSLFVINCSKKADHSLQDSNIMLEEPAPSAIVDTTAKNTPAPAVTPAPAPVVADSTATK